MRPSVSIRTRTIICVDIGLSYIYASYDKMYNILPNETIRWTLMCVNIGLSDIYASYAVKNSNRLDYSENSNQ